MDRVRAAKRERIARTKSVALQGRRDAIHQRVERSVVEAAALFDQRLVPRALPRVKADELGEGAERALEKLFGAAHGPEIGAGPNGWPNGPAWKVNGPLAAFWPTPGLL